MKILVTGAAGFIGNALMTALQKEDCEVVGIDNLNDFYDVRLKHDRLRRLGIEAANRPANEPIRSDRYANVSYRTLNLEDKAAIDSLFESEKFDSVVNLAGQAGVRYSITNPYAYLNSNVWGFLNILEACRFHPVQHLVYASSSSVYGLSEHVPFSETENVDQPVSLYAAFKKSNELMAHAYSKLYNLPTTGLRFFTVYGPWGRPDMSPMLFANAISHGETIKVFNNGHMLRDFTYIDDITEGILSTLRQAPRPEECRQGVCAKIYNIGCGHSIPLMEFITELEQQMGREARKEFLPMQPGDVFQTYADTSLLQRERGFKPRVQLHEGLGRFVNWYQQYYNQTK